MTERNRMCGVVPSSRYKAGFAPTCRHHRDQMAPAGYCMATAECGHQCDAITVFCPPYHLCYLHLGTATLPSPLFALPLTLREQIFQEALPRRIAAQHDAEDKDRTTNAMALLRVNRRFGAEAQHVLYHKVPHEVLIKANAVVLCNRILHPYYKGRSDVKYLGMTEPRDVGSLDDHAPLPALKLIQNFHVFIHAGYFGAAPYRVGGAELIYQEDFAIYSLRDTIQKFIRHIDQHQRAIPDQCGHIRPVIALELTPVITLNHANVWKQDEAMAVISLITEPFTALRKIACPKLNCISWAKAAKYSQLPRIKEAVELEYAEYQESWLDSMRNERGAVSMQSSLSQSSITVEVRATEEMIKIQDFVCVLIREGFAHMDAPKDPELEVTAFAGIARLLHATRVAGENFDLSALARIRQALKQRWIKFQKENSKRHRVANALLDTMTPNELGDTLNQHSWAFNFQLKKYNHDDMWWDLSIVELETINWVWGAETFEDSVRRYFKVGDQITACLKTPRFVREP